jgi:hypothetical protein
MKVFAAIITVALVGLASATAQNGSSPSSAPSATKQRAASTTAAGQSKIDPAKEADIRRLLDLVGTKALMKKMMESAITNIRPALTNALPPGDYRDKLIDLFLDKFKAQADLKQLIDMSVVAYDKHFSQEEIKGLIKFYETPLGQKAVSELPQLVIELSDAGRAWGERLGRECMEQVLTEHPDMQAALEAAGKAAQSR